jgi:hypothetical protein
MITPGERWIQLEGFSPRDGYRSMGVIIRWRRGAYKILFFTIRILKKKICNFELMRALWIHYARLFLLRPVLFPGCYGHVYVFRILGVIMKNKIVLFKYVWPRNCYCDIANNIWCDLSVGELNTAMFFHSRNMHLH